MKKCVVFILVCSGFIINLNAQLPNSSKWKEKSQLTGEKQNPLHSELIILSSENDYLANSVPSSTLHRSMDTINLIRHQSYDLNSDFSTYIPKNAYGFHKGRLLLHTTGATSSGTITGSGVVGTGSSLGNIGSTGSGIGLNGKTPQAGSGMWGNARGFISIPQEKKIVKQ